MMKSFLLLVLLLAVFDSSKGRSIEDADLSITLLHINDIHSHFEQVNENVGRCHDYQAANGSCYGGAARIYTKVNEIRGKDPSKTLFLNAGDYYQGTIWYNLYKYKVVAKFANMLNYTAFGVGNHDFDDGVAGLAPFMDLVNFPVLAANLNSNAVPELEGKFNKSTVVEIDGHQIGIIGYVTTDTPTISNPDPGLIFFDEIKSVKAEAARLKRQGVEILIATGHSGYELDKQMAAEVEDIDLVVGGHSHTFLFTGNQPPSVEEPRGDYPTYIKQTSGKVVPVVQVYCYSKYLGHMELNFKNGSLLMPVDGVGVSFAEPILLDNSVKQDEMVLREMEPYIQNMTEYHTSVGNTSVFLHRNGNKESNIGNVLTDSMRVHPWNDTTIAFMNNGGIRSDLIVGDITGEDIFAVLPFNNTVDRVTMKGSGITRVLEGFASRLCANQSCYPPTFLQVSGLKIHYLIRDDNIGRRIVSIQTPCFVNTDAQGCEQPVPVKQEAWCDLEPYTIYNVAVVSFIAQGGSKSLSFPDNIIDHQKGSSDYNTFKHYIAKNSPITQGVEGRLTFTYDDGTNVNRATTKTESTVVLILLVCSFLTFVQL